MIKKVLLSVVALLLVCAMAVQLTGCAMRVQAKNLMENVVANAVEDKKADDAFVNSHMDWTMKLLQKVISEGEGENVLISPLSIQLALAMTANGAEGQTKKEMEALLGGDVSLETLNAYLHTYAKNLPSEENCKVKTANSIWFRDNEAEFSPNQAFLQTNADYYNAQIYKAPFNEQTLQDINTWVDTYTDGMIDKILEEIDGNTVMYLINALTFDAKWEHTYEKRAVSDGTFTTLSGQEQTVPMMHSLEERYLQGQGAIGFRKNYAGGKYSFAALLPDEGTDVRDYIQNLTPEELSRILKQETISTVVATMPKFRCEASLTMNDILSEMGMPTAFDENAADFTQMGHSAWGRLYIGDVLHKTFINVDELGTKAGAVTKVEVDAEGAILPEVSITLDRPFVYMILDNATNLPLFIGILTEV